MSLAWQTEASHAVKCDLAREVLRSSGSLRLQVMGWSMLPTVWPGDTLLVESAEPATVSEGDILLYHRDQKLFVHRVVNAKSHNTILTRGDAMPRPDPPVRPDQMLGRVVSIVRNGEAIKPNRKLRASQRAVAGLVRRSTLAARVVVGIHGLRKPARA